MGSSINLRDRFDNHRALLKGGTHSNNHLQRSFNKHGIGKFVFEIIELCSGEDIIQREQEYIDQFDAKRLYNICRVAGSPPVFERTEEFREKMRKIKTGVKHTEESKRNMSAAQRSRAPLTPEQCEAIRIRQTGKTHTPETREKLSKINRGKILSDETRQKMSDNRLGVKRTEKEKEAMRIAARKRVERETREYLEKYFTREKIENAMVGAKTQSGILRNLGLGSSGCTLKHLREQALIHKIELPPKCRGKR